MKINRRSSSHGEAGYEVEATGFYRTDRWVTKCLTDFINPNGHVIWEPACGDGRMAEVISEAGATVISSDLYDRGFGFTGHDFLKSKAKFLDIECVNGIITNPPFRSDKHGMTIGMKFAELAVGLMENSGGYVAMLFRHEFDAPQYHHYLFCHPYKAKLILPRRPQWIDKKEGERESSARFPYAWYLWDWSKEESAHPTTHWLKEIP